ncbi:MAG: SIMPL domain-containing protein [Rhodospirillales bacterium]|nr:SIMPL domain-containing protein [Rhodospirillales bacterium]
MLRPRLVKSRRFRGLVCHRPIHFALDDDAEARDRARKLAVADARHTAEVYATAAGVRLGEVISMDGGGAQPARSRVLMGMQSAGVPVMPGEISVTARVHMVFALLPGG